MQEPEEKHEPVPESTVYEPAKPVVNQMALPSITPQQLNAFQETFKGEISALRNTIEDQDNVIHK